MKRYVLVGASGRATYMFAKSMVETFDYCTEIVGVFDINYKRIEALQELSGLYCSAYTDFEKMISETKPDAAIITTVDRFHHEYAIKCLEAGIEVIVEKPMTIDAEKCNALLEAEKRTGTKLTVTFNYRHTPYCTEIKQLITDGIVGDILSVDFEYLLNTAHGADYFRRWHRKKENSGGLLVHKSTHHFDLINWWIDEEPVQVMAYGSRRFYGPTRKERGERCKTCQYTNTCEFYWDISKEDFTKKMYLECEDVDGYFRDRCVFAEEIDIEDSMSVNVKYNKGAVLSYSLIAHCPYEGFKASINGTKGRLEVAEYHAGLNAADPSYYIDFYNRKGQKINYTIPKATGNHGGGDERLLKMIFEDNVPDPLNHMAGSIAGAVSILIGISANMSIAEGHDVKINDLVELDKFRK
jgi:predicted dehydrogenase